MAKQTTAKSGTTEQAAPKPETTDQDAAKTAATQGSGAQQDGAQGQDAPPAGDGGAAAASNSDALSGEGAGSAGDAKSSQILAGMEQALCAAAKFDVPDGSIAVRILQDYEVQDEHRGTDKATILREGDEGPMPLASAQHFISRGIAESI